jgi:glycosyltransferase involved in cell wall biosynthesis
MVDWYAPGFKAGGPIRSAVNFSDQLENELDIYILTTDRDLGEPQPYNGIEADRWLTRNAHHVFYISPQHLEWKNIKNIILEIQPDDIYLNSMFSRYFSIYPLLMKRMGILKSRLVLAPRGMLRVSALEHKSGKKKIFIGLFKTLGLSKGLVFHATDDTEEKDIRTIFGKSALLFKAGNLPGKQKPFSPARHKVPGELKIVFVGRIHPIKNLEFLLHALPGTNGEIELNVIATLEDEEYWQRCQSIINTFPPHIRVNILIDLPHEKVEENILLSHIFALPTKGENFGHSIFEALAAGRPVLISDQTPWRNLEKEKAGWDLSLDDVTAYRQIIQQLIGMDETHLKEWCIGAWNLADRYQANAATRKLTLQTFTGQA